MEELRLLVQPLEHAERLDADRRPRRERQLPILRLLERRLQRRPEPVHRERLEPAGRRARPLDAREAVEAAELAQLVGLLRDLRAPVPPDFERHRVARRVVERLEDLRVVARAQRLSHDVRADARARDDERTGRGDREAHRAEA